MYQIVKKGTEYELFSEGVINAIYTTITKEITTMLKATENPKPAIRFGGKKNADPIYPQ